MTEQAPLIKSKFRDREVFRFGRRSLVGYINEHVKVTDVFATCLSCRHFTANNYWCAKYKQHPPAEVIANSCIIGYEDAHEIPF